MTQLDEDLFGRDDGDPDHYPNPNEKTYYADPIPGQWIGQDKPVVEYQFDPVNRRVTGLDYDSTFDEELGDIHE